MSEYQKIESFTDLVAWQRGHQFVLEIYKITKYFPQDEKFGLTSQMRRAAVSITSNIAEGFGRKSYTERTQFYYIASASLSELKNQILIACDIGYLKKDSIEPLSELANESHKLLNGLIAKTKELNKSNQ